MSVQITSEQAQIVRELVNSGGYADERAVIDEALQALKARDRLRAALQEGLDELDRGEGLPASNIFQELRQRAGELNRNDS